MPGCEGEKLQLNWDLVSPTLYLQLQPVKIGFVSKDGSLAKLINDLIELDVFVPVGISGLIETIDLLFDDSNSSIY